MLDETIVTETPPLYDAYGRVGQQVEVPITGHRAKRILHGAINIRRGAVALGITEDWDADTHQWFLRLVRAQWRGWELLLFENKRPPPTAGGGSGLARPPGVWRV